jgi:hypothetical protein
VAEVLLFTVMTPIYVTLINDVFDRHFNRNFMLPAIIATAGAVAIRYNGVDSDFFTGIFDGAVCKSLFCCGAGGLETLIGQARTWAENYFWVVFYWSIAGGKSLLFYFW